MHQGYHSALCTGSNYLHFSLHENICSRFTLSFDQPRMIGTGRGTLHEAPGRAQTSVRDPSAYLRTHLHTKPRSLTQHTHGPRPPPPIPTRTHTTNPPHTTHISWIKPCTLLQLQKSSREYASTANDQQAQIHQVSVIWPPQGVITLGHVIQGENPLTETVYVGVNVSA